MSTCALEIKIRRGGRAHFVENHPLDEKRGLQRVLAPSMCDAFYAKVCKPIGDVAHDVSNRSKNP